MPSGDLVSRREARELLSLKSVSGVRHLEAKGILTPIRSEDGQVYFARAEVEAAAAEHRRTHQGGDNGAAGENSASSTGGSYGGALAARVFARFEAGERPETVVIAEACLPAQVAELHAQWLRLRRQPVDPQDASEQLEQLREELGHVRNQLDEVYDQEHPELAEAVDQVERRVRGLEGVVFQTVARTERLEAMVAWLVELVIPPPPSP